MHARNSEYQLMWKSILRCVIFFLINTCWASYFIDPANYAVFTFIQAGAADEHQVLSKFFMKAFGVLSADEALSFCRDLVQVLDVIALQYFSTNWGNLEALLEVNRKLDAAAPVCETVKW